MSETSTPPSDSETSGAAESATERIREIFQRFRIPGFDFESFIAARQSDIDAISKATSVAFAGAQTITEKQAELLRSALGELSGAVAARTAPLSAEAAELVQNTVSRSLDGMKEMAEAAKKSQTEIYEIALDRVRDNAERLRGMFVPPEK
jgi:phasin family protein